MNRYFGWNRNGWVGMLKKIDVCYGGKISWGFIKLGIIKIRKLKLKIFHVFDFRIKLFNVDIKILWRSILLIFKIHKYLSIIVILIKIF
jgi:hypothetical protein